MHRRSVAILAGLMLACSMSGAGSAATPVASPAAPCDPGESAKLVPVAGHAYHSAYFSWTGNETGYSSDSIDSFEQMTGKPVSAVVFSNHWGRNGNLSIRFPANLVQTIWANGSLPDLRMMPWTRNDYSGRPDPLISMQRIVNGRYDDALRTWFRNARDLGIPFMAEFGVEVNGEWFPWNGKYNGGGRTDGYGNKSYPDGPERFRDAYRHIVNLSRSVGADDITWSFHVDAGSWPRTWWNKPKYYYPGNAFVDWLAVSNYGEQVPGEEDWFPFTDKLGDPADARSSYRQIDALAPDKPFALIEFGVTEDPPNDKAKWISDAYDAVTPPGNAYDFQMVSYWSEKWENGDGSISDLRVNSSTAALAAYKAGVADAYFASTPQFACA